jgi:hypothetical protein
MFYTSGPTLEAFPVGGVGSFAPDAVAWATKTVEKIRAAVVGGLRFLPRLDGYTEETAEIRAAYRLMLREPVLKSSNRSKVSAVASLPWTVTPVSEDDRDVTIARFIKHCGKRVHGGTIGIARAIARGGLIDGFSVSNKVMMTEVTGEFSGKWIWKYFKPKDTQNLTLSTDQYRNVTAVRPLYFGIGEAYSPSDFAIYSHDSLFDSPLGTSDHRSAYGCYDDETEVLTEQGWKRFIDLTDTDAVATLDRSSGPGRLVYQVPTERFNAPYLGKMFCQTGRFIDLRVTPNHRMYVGTRQARNFRILEARELMEGDYSRMVRYKRDAEWEGAEVDFFMLPEMKYSQRVSNGFGQNYSIREKVFAERRLPMDDWLRFLGFWLAEGGTHRRKTGNRQCSVTITQNSGPILDEMVEVVRRLGFSYCLQTYASKTACKLKISSLQLWDYLRQLGGRHTKYIPQCFKSLSSRQLEILLEWMLKGDGRHDGAQYATVSKRLADDVSELALKTGRAPTCYQERMTYHETPTFINIVSLNERSIDGTLVNEHEDNRSWVDYDGGIHCVTVPNGIIYVRRNGKCCWCGNSFWFKDTIKKLWGLHLDKYVSPMLMGTYQTVDQKAALEVALEQARANTWMTIPTGVLVSAVQMATRGEAEFLAACQYQDQQMLIATEGGYLQRLEGQTPDGRGDTGVHKAGQTSNEWDLASDVQQVINEQLVPELIELNYAGADCPEVTLGAVSDSEMTSSLAIDQGLKEMGFKHSRKAIAKAYSREEATDPEDVLGAEPPEANAGVAGADPFSVPTPGLDGANLFYERGSRLGGADYFRGRRRVLFRNMRQG